MHFLKAGAGRKLWNNNWFLSIKSATYLIRLTEEDRMWTKQLAESEGNVLEMCLSQKIMDDTCTTLLISRLAYMQPSFKKHR